MAPEYINYGSQKEVFSLDFAHYHTSQQVRALRENPPLLQCPPETAGDRKIERSKLLNGHLANYSVLVICKHRQLKFSYHWYSLNQYLITFYYTLKTEEGGFGWLNSTQRMKKYKHVKMSGWGTFLGLSQMTSISPPECRMQVMNEKRRLQSNGTTAWTISSSWWRLLDTTVSL